MSRGRVPLIVGGTGLYMRTLLEGGASGAPQSTRETKAWINTLVETEDGGDWDKRCVKQLRDSLGEGGASCVYQ